MWNTRTWRSVILTIAAAATGAALAYRAAWACPKAPESVPRIAVGSQQVQVAYLGFDRNQGFRFVNFHGCYSYDPDGGEIQEFAWAYQDDPFPDEAHYHQSCVSKTYYESGVFWEIELFVTDDENQTDVDMCHLYLVESILNVYYAGAWMDDPEEYDGGAFVTLNEDDDNGNGIPDKHDAGTVQYENDLVPLFVWTDPPAFWLEQGSLTLEIVSGTSRIKVWRYNDKRMELTLPTTWPIHQVLGETFYIEGVDVSGSLRDVELKLTYACGSESSVDRVRLTVLELRIDTPDSYPAFVCRWKDSAGERLQLGCSVIPAGAGGGTYQWSKVTGPGTVTFTPSATVDDPKLSADQPGKYAVKVEYTVSGVTFSDTTELGTRGANGDIVAWEIELVDSSSHRSIEGFRPDRTQVNGNLLGSQWGDDEVGHNELVYYVYDCYRMTTDGNGFVAKYGAGSELRASGDRADLVFLDIGDATVNLMVSATWDAAAWVSPECTELNNGASASCRLKGKAGYYSAIVHNGIREVTPSGPNPVTWSGSVNGREEIGEVYASVSYQDKGANPDASAYAEIAVTYSVSPAGGP